VSIRPEILRAIDRLAAGNPTPFFLFDRVQARSDARAWNRAARAAGNVRLFYAMKCNRHGPLLDTAFAEGLGAEVNTGNDLDDVDRRRLPPDSVLLQGPAKTEKMLADAIAHGHRIALDNPEEVARFGALSLAAGKEPRCLWRIRPEGNLAEETQREFGLTISEATRLLRGRSGRDGIPPEGFAVHLGTGLSSPRPFVRAIEQMAPLFARLARLGRPASAVGAGGGFGSSSEQRLDRRGRPRPVSATAGEFVRAISAARRRYLGSDVELLLEPGRALASRAFLLVARVLGVRQRGGEAAVFVDASALSHARFVPRGRHHIFARPARRGRMLRCSIQGPLGSGLDTLVDRWNSPLPRNGDLLVIEAVGAYNLISANAWAGRLPSVLEP
jgi:diaminopimelate decarboxylase